MIENFLKSRIAIVGGGKFCRRLLEHLLHNDHGMQQAAILGVADTDPRAPGLLYARQMGIHTTDDYRKLVDTTRPETVLELTNDETVRDTLVKILPENVRLIDHIEARSLWTSALIYDEEHRAVGELERLSGASDEIRAVFEAYAGRMSKIVARRSNRYEAIEREFVRNQQTLSQIIDGSMIPTFVINKEHRVTHWNKAMEQLTGCPAANVIGTNRQWSPFWKNQRPSMADVVLDQIPHEEIEKLYSRKWRKSDIIQGAYEAKVFFSTIGEEGKWCWFTAAPIKDPDGSIVGAIETLWDITEDKKAEAQRERHTRELAAHCAVYAALNAQSSIDEKISRAIAEIKSYLCASLISIFLQREDGKFYLRFTCDDTDHLVGKNDVLDTTSPVCKVGETKRPLVYEDLRRHGENKEVRLLAERGMQYLAYIPIRTNEKEGFGVMRIGGKTVRSLSPDEMRVLDLIANRMGATIENDFLQQKLRQISNFRKKLIRSSNDGIIATDVDMNIVIFNPGAESIFGYSYTEVIGKMKAETLYSDVILETLKSSLVSGDHSYKEARIENKFGERIPVRFSATHLFEKGKPMGTVAFFQDLREIKSLEKEVVKSERLAAIGQTIASLSHGVKNILHGFKGGAYLLNIGIERDDGSRIKAGWRMVQRNMERMSELVMDMLSYSKEREPECRMCSLNAIANEVCDALEMTADENNVRLVRELDRHMGEVYVDPRTVHTILMNLVTNAIDACVFDEHTGKQYRVIVKTAREAGGFIRLDVQDNGSGISDAVKAKLFSSFFSTKGNKGTGLGLLVTKKLIQEHKGSIRVDSQLAEGTTFTVRLPYKTDENE